MAKMVPQNLKTMGRERISGWRQLPTMKVGEGGYAVMKKIQRVGKKKMNEEKNIYILFFLGSPSCIVATTGKTKK